MNLKYFCCALICGIVTLSPAPIRDLKDGEHALPKQSAEQVASEQKFDGVVDPVGAVLQKTNADGTGPPTITNDTKASIALASTRLPSAQTKAIENLGKASRQLKLDGSTGPNPLVVGIVVLCLVAALLYAAKIVLEKIGPAPKSFNPAEKIR